jgi:hypothetical protein
VRPTANQHTGFNDVRQGFDIGVSICISNLSSQPVYDVEVLVTDGGTIDTKFGFNVLAPKQDVEEALDEANVGKLRMAFVGLDARATTKGEALTGARKISKDLRVDLTFRDVEGRKWRRNGHGILEEVPPEVQ